MNIKFALLVYNLFIVCLSLLGFVVTKSPWCFLLLFAIMVETNGKSKKDEQEQE